MGDTTDPTKTLTLTEIADYLDSWLRWWKSRLHKHEGTLERQYFGGAIAVLQAVRVELCSEPLGEPPGKGRIVRSSHWRR